VPDDRHAWERAGAFEVAPGVHRIPLPLPGDGLRAVNVYAIADGERVVLVDSGWALAEARDRLAAALATIGYGFADVREFLVTHVHRDHYTQAVALRREFGTRVSLGEAERATLDLLRTLDRNPEADRLRAAGAADLARRIEGWHPPELADWEYPDGWLADRREIELHTRSLTVIATPGHTRGHVVLHDPAAGTLFAGDHVLPHITPSIGFELARPPSPLRDYLASLDLVRALPDARLLPAHGPVTGSVHERVDELLAHHEQRLADTEAAVRAGSPSGAATGFAVAQALAWTRRGRRFAELDVFNQVLAVLETVAHLDVLAERGRLARREQGGPVEYLPSPGDSA
jgi:glyoxylase-like metal-dependent hydrolase (beta-lactamase superfamily II)